MTEKSRAIDLDQNLPRARKYIDFMDTDETAELSRELARLRNLLAMCVDEDVCRIIRGLIAEAEQKLKALKEAA